MKTKLVTAFYTDVKGFPYFAHESFARHERYLHSLRTIANTGLEIVVYCNETQYNLLVEHCNKFELSNVTIKVSNLKDYPKSEKMVDIKTRINDFLFYHEIDWNKFYILSKEYDETYDYIYWIDIGLSHPGLFLDKYNPYQDKCDGMSRTFECYSYLNLFQPTLFQKINSYIGDKLLNCSNTMFSHNMNVASKVVGIPYQERSISVGGILGGHISKMKWFLSEFDILGDHILNNDHIINHEAMISFIVQDKPDNFKTFVFNTWYHDDYWKKTPVFDNESTTVKTVLKMPRYLRMMV
jgi:hypothetical protein